MADRNPSKKRRQAQNKALREEREARAAAARIAPDERRAPAKPDAKPGRSERGAKSATKAQRSPRAAKPAAAAEVAEQAKPARTHSVFASKRGRNNDAASEAGPRPARTATGVARATGTAAAIAPTRTANRPKRAVVEDASSGHDETSEFDDELTDDIDDEFEDAAALPDEPRLPGRPLPVWLDRFGANEPGGRWVLMSFLMVIVASIVVSVTPVVPEQRLQANGKYKATGKLLSIWNFGLLQGFVYLLPPLLAVGLAIAFARPPERRRSWNRGLFALALLSMLGGGIYIYAVSIACLAWGCWQARKAALAAVGNDAAALRAQSRALRAERAASSRWARRGSEDDDTVAKQSRWSRRSNEADGTVADDSGRRNASTADGSVNDNSGRRKSKRVTQGK